LCGLSQPLLELALYREVARDTENADDVTADDDRHVGHRHAHGPTAAMRDADLVLRRLSFDRRMKMRHGGGEIIGTNQRLERRTEQLTRRVAGQVVARRI